jgi:hypothetical protein
MPYKYLGLLQALLLLGAIALTIPALIQWEIWNGLDLLALIVWMGALAALAAEPNP